MMPGRLGADGERVQRGQVLGTEGMHYLADRVLIRPFDKP